MQQERQMQASRDMARAKSIAQSDKKLTEIFMNALAELGLDKIV